MTPRRASLSVLTALAFAVLAACASDPRQGYSFTPAFPQDVRTVAVPVFDNSTFDKGLETEVTEALIKEIQARTNWTVVGPAAADSTITGVVVRSELQRLSVSRNTGLVQEVAYRVTVDFDWKDNRSGKVLVSKRGVTSFESFVPARGTGEPAETGRHATVQALAREIVGTLRDAW